MQNKKNKGFSMVEVVIALAILVILMMPIVSGLISSMKNTTKSKDLQYRNEYAANLMEYAKQASMDEIIAGTYYSSIGSYDMKLPVLDAPSGNYATNGYEKGSVTSGDGSKVAEYEKYRIQGSMNLGTEHKKYSYIMEISNEPYAVKEVDNDFANPNNLKLGVVEDLDYSKLALINGTIANYDKSVANAFLAKKIEILRDKSPVKYEQYISSENQVDLFSNDTATRVITVKVEGEEKKGYKVSCTLSYQDHSNVALDNGKKMGDYLTKPIEYTPYTAEFEKLPDIYLMYNTCVYNGAYALADYIVFDTEDLKDNTEVNAFLVETAEKSSTAISEVMKEEGYSDPDRSLIYDSSKITHGTTDRNDVHIYLAATDGSRLSVTEDGVQKHLLNVYHNFGIVPDEDFTESDGTVSKKKAPNQKNEHLHYNTGLGSYLDSAKFIDLTDAKVASLNEATQEKRGLYTINIWMAEGEISDVDITKEPIITGTKGGNES